MLTGKNLVLRAWKDSDLPKLTALRNDLDLQAQLMTQPRPNSVARVVRWLQEKSEKPDGVFFVVAERASDAALGYLQIQQMDMQNRHCSLGICLATEAQGMGYGHEALTLVERYMKQTFGVRKIMLEVLQSNASAIRFYERYGFQKVGVMKAHFQVGDQHVDVLIMEKFA